MAGNDEGNLVVPHGAAHGLSRHTLKAFLGRQPPRQRAVGGRLAVGNLQQQPPDSLPEGRADGVQRRRKIRLMAAEIAVQPAAGFGQYGRVLLGRFTGQHGGKVFLTLEPESGQAQIVRRKEDAAQRRSVMLNIRHG